MWVYIRSEPGLLTVGFYSPDGEWHPESDHSTSEEAADRVHYLNGALQDRNDADHDGPPNRLEASTE